MVSSSGFRIPKRTALLKLDGAYEGAELRCALDVSMDCYFQIQRLADTNESGEIVKVMRTFGDQVLMDWNFTDGEGNALPANAEGFLTLPFTIVSVIFEKWAKAVAEVPSPLGRD